MKKVAVHALLTCVIALSSLQARAQTLAPELRNVLPSATLMGQATMTFWGFDVYHAGLWVAPGFSGAQYHQTPFALSLTYLRSLQGSEIAKRSIVEMRRQGPMTAQDEAAWESQMRVLFPNVNTGDNLTGVHLPGRGVEFWSGGRKLGEVRDIAFSQRFFGIWLSPRTSEPALRLALLASAAPP
jgi:hypothetical protein